MTALPTIFEPTPLVQATTTDLDVDYLSQLVGQGKPYSDDKALAKAKAHGDIHIQTLESELKTLRDDLKARQTMEQLMDKISSAAASKSKEPEQKVPELTSDSKPSLNAEQISDLVRQTLTRSQEQDLRTTNLNSIRETLLSSWGPNFVSQIERKAKELQVSHAFLDNLAATSPEAFKKLVGLTVSNEEVSRKSDAPPRSSINTSNMQPTLGKNKQFYTDMRRKDPSTYWSQKVQDELFKQVEANPRFLD